MRLACVLRLAVLAVLVSVDRTPWALADPDVPPVSDAASAAGFVDIHSVIPDAILDLRYATTNNFTHTQLYPSDARCLVHQSMAPGLATAAGALRPQGHLLVFWDCYRPHDVQVKMFNLVPDPAWVARPGPFAHSHESGRSVDVTFTTTQEPCSSGLHAGGLCLADMAPTSTTSRLVQPLSTHRASAPTLWRTGRRCARP